MTIDLRVVGIFPLPTLPPEPADQHDGNNGYEEDDGLGRRMFLKKAASVLLMVAELRIALLFMFLVLGLGMLNFVRLCCRGTHLLFTCMQLFMVACSFGLVIVLRRRMLRIASRRRKLLPRRNELCFSYYS